MVTRGTDLGSLDGLHKVIPTSSHDRITQVDASYIKCMGKDTDILQEYLEDMFVTNLNIFVDSKDVQVRAYTDAIKFVALCQCTKTMKEAWERTFPDRAYELRIKGKEHLGSNYASMYNKKPLVAKLSEQCMVAMHVQYAGIRHEAVMHNLKLMRGEASPSSVPRMAKNESTGKKEPVLNEFGDVIYDTIHMAVSPTVQQLASKTLLDATAIPIDNVVKIEHGISDSVVEAQTATSDALNNLAITMHKALMNGGSINEVQVIGNVIDTEAEDES